MDVFNQNVLPDEQIRMECVNLVVQREHGYNFPVYHMIEAEMLYQYVKSGKIPMSGFENAGIAVEMLLNTSLDQLINERKNSNQTADSSNKNADSLQIPESFVNRFLSKLRRK